MVKRVNFRFDREDSKLEGFDPGILEYWGGRLDVRGADGYLFF